MGDYDKDIKSRCDTTASCMNENVVIPLVTTLASYPSPLVRTWDKDPGARSLPSLLGINILGTMLVYAFTASSHPTELVTKWYAVRHHELGKRHSMLAYGSTMWVPVRALCKITHLLLHVV